MLLEKNLLIASLHITYREEIILITKTVTPQLFSSAHLLLDRLFIHVSNHLSGNENAQMLVDHIKDNNNNNNQVFKT